MLRRFCENGHVTNSMAQDYPNSNQDYCDKCGGPTIMACPSCQTAIRGAYHVPGIFGSEHLRSVGRSAVSARSINVCERMKRALAPTGGGYVQGFSAKKTRYSGQCGPGHPPLECFAAFLPGLDDVDAAAKKQSLPRSQSGLSTTLPRKSPSCGSQSLSPTLDIALQTPQDRDRTG